MTSKIINMAERIRDAEDRALEALFRSEPIDDDGFSRRIVRRIRRQIWLRRLTLPAALVIGLAIAAGPAVELLRLVGRLLSLLPGNLAGLPEQALPQMPLILVGAALFVVGWLSIRMLEE